MNTALLGCVQTCDLAGAAVRAAACVQQCVVQHTECSLDELTGVDDKEGISSTVSLFLAVLLIPLTGLFAGLTLGLLSLDIVGLKILIEAGDPEERKYASTILPVRRQGNLLLCTLLLGNTVINSAISILLADLTTGAIGLVVATFSILIFGEIVPQSICSQKDIGLKIGAHSIWLVKFFMLVLSPIVWPISKVLDCCLGRDIGTVYSQEELKHLIEIHVSDPDAQAESGLTTADQKLMIGALEYKDKRVQDVMTSLEHVFMLERSLHLTFQTMLAIYKSGFTRIPVYEDSRDNIVGILYAKDLILVDPDDGVEINAVLSFRGRNAPLVSETEPLDVVFKLFMTSYHHMLLATDRAGTVTGLITLEDVMEEILQAEIVDETDIFEDVERRVPRQVAARADVATFMTMFEHKLRHQHALSSSEVQAVAAFLSLNVQEFAAVAHLQLSLEGLISHAEVLERDPDSPASTLDRHSPASEGGPHPMLTTPPGESSAARTRFLNRGSHSFSFREWHEGGSKDEEALTLYQASQPSDMFTLILQGKAFIHAGCEGFELEMGPWSVLGNKALSSDAYVPDFDAVMWPPYRVLRIKRAAYRAAQEAANLGPVIGYQRGRVAPATASDRVSPGQVPRLLPARAAATKLQPLVLTPRGSSPAPPGDSGDIPRGNSGGSGGQASPGHLNSIADARAGQGDSGLELMVMRGSEEEHGDHSPLLGGGHKNS